MSIRDELLETIGIKPKKSEGDPALIKRLIGKAEDLNDGEGLDDDSWEKLSTETQEFYNSVIQAGKKHAGGVVTELNDEDVPPFPDENGGEDDRPEDEDDRTEEEPEEDNEEEGEEVMETKTKKTVAKKAPAKKTAADKSKTAADKSEKKAAKKNGSGEKKTSMRRRLKQLVIKKPTISLEDLMAKLTGEGYKATKMTVGSMRSSTRDTLKLLVEAGLLEIQL